MVNSVDYHMTEIYYFVDEFLKTHPALARRRRKKSAPGRSPERV